MANCPVRPEAQQLYATSSSPITINQPLADFDFSSIYKFPEMEAKWPREKFPLEPKVGREGKIIFPGNSRDFWKKKFHSMTTGFLQREILINSLLKCIERHKPWFVRWNILSSFNFLNPVQIGATKKHRNGTRGKQSSSQVRHLLKVEGLSLSNRHVLVSRRRNDWNSSKCYKFYNKMIEFAVIVYFSRLMITSYIICKKDASIRSEVVVPLGLDAMTSL